MRIANYLLSVFILGWIIVGFSAAPAHAAIGCTVSEAKDELAAAKRALERAEARVSKARYVLSQTIVYTDEYGTSVGRWVRLALQHYSRAELQTVMATVNRESRGDIYALNPSGALGLMQIMPEWANGSKDWYWNQWSLPSLWDRTNPRETFRHATHMAWSNWGY